ncbi:hypothetical protein SMSK597_1873 [Streptococcus mitis SK597]|uniref:Uncharacterized protein n=1 Tax=Streptococcus mitis SK597 TaxID=585204 RepID=E1LV84_STRMT|nr:hypothetical protein SMSK597_1873 [Streptococcus mitis SK597]
MAFLELKNIEKPAKTRFASCGWSFLGTSFNEYTVYKM